MGGGKEYTPASLDRMFLWLTITCVMEILEISVDFDGGSPK